MRFSFLEYSHVHVVYKILQAHGICFAKPRRVDPKQNQSPPKVHFFCSSWITAFSATAQLSSDQLFSL